MESPLQLAVQAKNLLMNPALALQSLEILEYAIDEVCPETFPLLLVEPGSFDQIPPGFNPKFDPH